MRSVNIRDQKQSAIRIWPALVLLASLTVALTAGTALAQSEDQPRTASVASLFEDFLHFARLGKFSEADAYARQLLDHPDLEPVELLKLADRDRRSFDTLMLLISNTPIGENAARVLEVIQQGERELRKDVTRIKANIDKLDGPPQMEHNAIARLRDSGEYAVPWMLRTLQDPQQGRLHGRIIAALPKLGREAVTPLSIALQVQDPVLRLQIVRVLGQLGYAHAAPYLQQTLLDEHATPEIKSAAREAILAISGGRAVEDSMATARAYFGLGEQYYDEVGSVAADARLSVANVWYWNEDEQFAEATVVPQRVFGAVMAMRCCERALQIEPSYHEAIALWLAANIRREARLGLNVESPSPGEPDEADDTRPADFPPSLYFTRLAGARYAHLALQRAIHDRDEVVALGALAALRAVAGESSLIGNEDYKQPLAQALEFPNRLVRIRAALALGNALPKTPFAGARWVMPVLNDALQASTTVERYVVVEPDADQRNRVAEALRSQGSEVLADDNFHKAMDRVRREWGGASAFFLSAQMTVPDLLTAVATLGRDFAYARTPIVVLADSPSSAIAEQAAQAGTNVGVITAADEAPEALAQVRERMTAVTIDADLARTIALEAANTFYRLALDGNRVINFAAAEPALIGALERDDEELQTRCAQVLALIRTATAQQALADVAFDDGNSAELRTTAYGALAESAGRFGNHLDEPRVAQLLGLARDEADMDLRTAASRALGALNLADNKASEVIRGYSRG